MTRLLCWIQNKNYRVVHLAVRSETNINSFGGPVACRICLSVVTDLPVLDRCSADMIVTPFNVELIRCRYIPLKGSR